MTKTVVIVDSNIIYRSGLAALLERRPPGLKVLDCLSPDRTVYAVLEQHQPSVVVWSLEAGTGDQIKRLKRTIPASGLVILADLYLQEDLFYAVKFGAAAYLPRQGDPAPLVEGIVQVANGTYLINDLVFTEPELALRVLESFRSLAQSEEALKALYCPLSPREKEVLQRIAEGNTNQQIASLLGISSQTVKNHITTIMRKLSANDRTQAVVEALRSGWIS